MMELIKSNAVGQETPKAKKNSEDWMNFADVERKLYFVDFAQCYQNNMENSKSEQREKLSQLLIPKMNYIKNKSM